MTATSTFRSGRMVRGCDDLTALIQASRHIFQVEIGNPKGVLEDEREAGLLLEGDSYGTSGHVELAQAYRNVGTLGI
jgi:hypothetical protein